MYVCVRVRVRVRVRARARACVCVRVCVCVQLTAVELRHCWSEAESRQPGSPQAWLKELTGLLQSHFTGATPDKEHTLAGLGTGEHDGCCRVVLWVERFVLLWSLCTEAEGPSFWGGGGGEGRGCVLVCLKMG